MSCTTKRYSVTCNLAILPLTPRAVKHCNKVINLLTLKEGKDISNIELMAAHTVISHFPHKFHKDLKDKLKSNLEKRDIPGSLIVDGRIKICDMGIHFKSMRWLDS